MIFVRNLQEIEANAFYLADLVHGTESERIAAIELIGKGRAFFPFVYDGDIAFSPSKFIGYRSNSIETHLKERSGRDGKDTNREINRILGVRYVENEMLHSSLEDYCRRIGAKLENHKHRFWPTQSASRLVARFSSALNDIDPEDNGLDRPNYRKAMAGGFVRNQKVRMKVLERANGRCEYCSSCGFLKEVGGRYLETHHIISLSKNGPDRLSNVIALCPNHHRQAHFGKAWEALQAEFKQIIASKS